MIFLTILCFAFGVTWFIATAYMIAIHSEIEGATFRNWLVSVVAMILQVVIYNALPTAGAFTLGLHYLSQI